MEAPETEPVSIAETVTVAINAHDVDGALVCFAENAVLHTPGRQPSSTSGKTRYARGCKTMPITTSPSKSKLCRSPGRL